MYEKKPNATCKGNKIRYITLAASERCLICQPFPGHIERAGDVSGRRRKQRCEDVL